MKKTLAVLGLLLALPAFAPADDEPRTVVLKAARLFDGRSDTTVSGGVVIVQDGKIVSLARLRYTPGSKTVTYLPSAGHDDEPTQTFDALDFVARILAQVPDPRRHLVHYYGVYSNVARGKLKARVKAEA